MLLQSLIAAGNKVAALLLCTLLLAPGNVVLYAQQGPPRPRRRARLSHPTNSPTW